MESKAPSLSVQQLHAGRQTGWPASGLKPLGAWVLHHRWVTAAALALTLIIVVGATWWLRTSSPVEYLTAPVTRGDVVKTITASGTVNPVIIVEVGTYVSGPIEALSCDYNTKVHKGQLCAKIVAHARYVTFQKAEVAVPGQLFEGILRMIDGLRPRSTPT